MTTHKRGESAWHDGELHYQQLAGVSDSGRMRRAIMAEMPPIAMSFVEAQELAALGTVDAAGSPWAWVLFGPAGFLRAPTPTQLKISAAGLPAAGPRLLEHISAHPEVGSIVLEPSTRRRMRINGRGMLNAAGDFQILADEVFSNCPKYIQSRAPQSGLSTSPALRSGETRPELDERDVRILSAADSFFIATTHETAGADVSHRGGRPGFLRVAEGNRLQFPDYAGNNMFQTLGNLFLDERAGIAVPDFSAGELLQLTGKAVVTDDPTLVATFRQAKRVIEFTPQHVVHSTWEGFVPWTFGDFSPALPPESVG